MSAVRSAARSTAAHYPPAKTVAAGQVGVAWEALLLEALELAIRYALERCEASPETVIELARRRRLIALDAAGAAGQFAARQAYPWYLRWYYRRSIATLAEGLAEALLDATAAGDLATVAAVQAEVRG